MIRDHRVHIWWAFLLLEVEWQSRNGILEDAKAFAEKERVERFAVLIERLESKK